MRTNRLAVAAAVAGAVAAAGCSSLLRRDFAEPVVTFQSVKLNGLGLTGGSLDVNLSVYNPNRFALDATQLTYRLWVDTIPLGSGQTDSRFTVQAGDSTTVRLPLNFQWAGLNTAAREMINTGSVNYRVAGDIKVGSPVGTYTIPYDRTGRFSALSGTTR